MISTLSLTSATVLYKLFSTATLALLLLEGPVAVSLSGLRSFSPEEHVAHFLILQSLCPNSNFSVEPNTAPKFILQPLAQ
jgi:hypothetical protein